MGNGIFSMGTRAVLVNQSVISTIGHNIANVNTAGYSRQDVQLANENGMYTGAGFFGNGVKIVTVSRQTNEFLVKQANINASAYASDTARLDKLRQLESAFGTGEAGLGYAASQLLNAFVDVADQPQDMSARQVALGRAQEWVSRVNTAGNQLTELQAGTVSDLKVNIDQVNALTKQIASVNQSIARYKGIGHEPNDLLDQRDQLVKQLNQLVQVSSVMADDGSMNLFLGGGQALVLGTQTQELRVVRDANDSSLARIALHDAQSNTDRVLDSAQFTGGSVTGLLNFQDQDLATARSNLNAFVQTFADAVNAQHALGVDAQGNLLTSFDAAGNPVAQPFFTNTGSATGIRLAINSPQGIGAASPLVATVPPTNQGTATVNSLVMTRAIPSGTAPDAATSLPTAGSPLSVVFEADPGDPSVMTYRFVDGNGNPYKDVAPARVWTPGTPITDEDPNSVPSTPLFNLNIAGVPANGDTITIQATQYPAQNNGNALAMLDLRDKTMVSIDGATQHTVTDAYAQMIGNVGVMVQSGQTSADISKTLTATSDGLLDSVRGVNLDEEAARLIQFQQSYQAAAKILQVAQTVFDVLLDTAR